MKKIQKLAPDFGPASTFFFLVYSLKKQNKNKKAIYWKQLNKYSIYGNTKT